MPNECDSVAHNGMGGVDVAISCSVERRSADESDGVLASRRAADRGRETTSLPKRAAIAQLVDDEAALKHKVLLQFQCRRSKSRLEQRHTIKLV